MMGPSYNDYRPMVAKLEADLAIRDRRIAELEALLQEANNAIRSITDRAAMKHAIAAARRQALELAEETIRPRLTISSEYVNCKNTMDAAWQAMEDCADKLRQLAGEVTNG